ncbi:conserved membrane-spanning protein [Alloactinosynnema sp. L-07]|uniref:DUF4184 family protein n=1 Tax=Alloactinosynnema sp. L-07 TaxID=1653480 RepID=UPI00065F065D|nr:DUF4184 family protein [Alloactinosynnema sp. L-07]CRK62213.1 conserved membrane-spanning protein [Alloactinosynnema sp. L-07]
MPFTLAHPAAVLPFFRTRLPTSALVAGALAPDLLQFAGLSRLDTGFTHTIPGFILTIPLALILTAVWHHCAQEAALALSPRRFARAPLPKPIPAIAAAALGISTHLVWDAFTHSHGFVVERIPMFRRFVWPDMPLFFFLQVAFSFVGVGVLLVHVVRRCRRLPRKRPTLSVAAVVLIAAGVFAVIAAVDAMAVARPDLRAEVGFVRGAVGATSGFATGMIVCGLLLRRGSFRSVP